MWLLRTGGGGGGGGASKFHFSLQKVIKKFKEVSM